MAKKSIPITVLSFLLKRALEITLAKQKIARETGIPLSKQGLERKIGNSKSIVRKEIVIGVIAWMCSKNQNNPEYKAIRDLLEHEIDLMSK